MLALCRDDWRIDGGGFRVEEGGERTFLEWDGSMLTGTPIDPASGRALPGVRRTIDLEALRKDVIDYPDAYQHERAQRFGVAQNAIFFALKKLQLTTEQQSEIAGYVDRDGMTALEAAQKWVDANPDIVSGWMA